MSGKIHQITEAQLRNVTTCRRQHPHPKEACDGATKLYRIVQGKEPEEIGEVLSADIPIRDLTGRADPEIERLVKEDILLRGEVVVRMNFVEDQDSMNRRAAHARAFHEKQHENRLFDDERKYASGPFDLFLRQFDVLCRIRPLIGLQRRLERGY